MELFAATDYRAYLTDYLRKNETRGFHKALAQAAGCQASYLSRVLAGTVHLTPDHAANLARFLNFDGLETAYFLDLVNLERAGTPALRAILEERLRVLREEARAAALQIHTPQARDEDILYYSHWMLAAIHVLVSIPSLQTSEALAARLKMPRSSIEEMGALLLRLGLVKREGSRWLPSQRSIHAAKNSPAAFMHLNNWRQHAVQRSFQSGADAIHFSGLYSLSKSDAAKLQSELVHFIGRASERAQASPEQDACCVNIDFFMI